MADLSSYDHDQSSASATWNINHNLGTQDVAVDAVINVGSPAVLTKAIPLTITITDNNNITITWSAAQSGKTRIVGGGDD